MKTEMIDHWIPLFDQNGQHWDKQKDWSSYRHNQACRVVHELLDRRQLPWRSPSRTISHRSPEMYPWEERFATVKRLQQNTHHTQIFIMKANVLFFFFKASFYEWITVDTIHWLPYTLFLLRHDCKGLSLFLRSNAWRLTSQERFLIAIFPYSSFDTLCCLFFFL